MIGITIYTKEEMKNEKEAGMAAINNAQKHFYDIKARMSKCGNNEVEIPGFQEVADLCDYFWIPNDGSASTVEAMKYLLDHCARNDNLKKIIKAGEMIGFPFDTEGEGILFLTGITRADFEEKAVKFWIHLLEMTNEALLTEIESFRAEKALDT